MKLILASASPRRRELLQAAGISVVARATDIPEIPADGEAPRNFAERLAREKALAIAYRHPESAVLGADTIVVVDGIILGKPVDPVDAARMLRMLSGRTHEVITAVCLVAPAASHSREGDRATEIRSATTQVTFSRMSEEEIASYVATGEPMDKAGAYGIQGLAARWIPKVVGDYSNVVGLPVAMVYQMMRERGLV